MTYLPWQWRSSLQEAFDNQESWVRIKFGTVMVQYCFTTICILFLLSSVVFASREVEEYGYIRHGEEWRISPLVT
jgi:hypothetical protein